MNTSNDSRTTELNAIIHQKLTVLFVEMEEAGWSAEDVAFAIEDVLGQKWLRQAKALRRARAALPDDFVSDGNEG